MDSRDPCDGRYCGRGVVLKAIEAKLEDQRKRSDKFERDTFKPVNERIAQEYRRSHPTISQLDYGEEAKEVTKTQDVRTLVRRAKRAESIVRVIKAATPIGLGILALLEILLRTHC